MPPNYDEIRRKVAEILKARHSQSDFKELSNIAEPVRDYLRQTYGEPARDLYANVINDVIWDFMIQGILAPFRENSRDLPWIHVTAYGKKCLDENVLLAYDPAGFLAQVFSEVPQLDQIAKDYLGEAVQGFNTRLYLSATITLGTASEHLVLQLIDAYKVALQPGAKMSFEKKIKGRPFASQFDEFEKSLQVKLDSGAVPGEYEEDFRNRIKPLFELYRQNRNAAGHPTGMSVDANILRTHLEAFAPYAKRLFKLVAYFNSHLGQL